MANIQQYEFGTDSFRVVAKDTMREYDIITQGKHTKQE